MLYAIGDLHADLAQSRAALQLLGLVDDQLRWTGGNATLVQTGDLVDRGPDSLPLLRQWWELKSQAHAAGGRVVTLLGNHEALNLEGDLRYVDTAELAAAGGSAAWKRLFSADEGEIGRVISSYDTAVVAGDGPCRTLFVHAGLRPQLIERGEGGGTAQLARLNQQAREELRSVRRKGARGLLGNDGPVWYRGYAQEDEATVCESLRRALRSVGAWRMVSGHTITPSHRAILPRCGGAFHMIDVGMSKAYYGSLAAWSCEASSAEEAGGGEWGRVVAHYPRQGEGARRRPRRVAPALPREALLQTVYVPRGGGDSSVGSAAAAQEEHQQEELTLEPWAAVAARDAAALAAACSADPLCRGFSVAGDGTSEAEGPIAAPPIGAATAGSGGLLRMRAVGGDDAAAAAAASAAQRAQPSAALKSLVDTRHTAADERRRAEEAAAATAANTPRARRPQQRPPGRLAVRLGKWLVAALFVGAACLGWKARSKVTSLRRVASFLRIRPKKTVECDV